MLNISSTLTIVTPTIGNYKYLKRNVLSVQSQIITETEFEKMTYKHLIVIDGKEYEEKVMIVLKELDVIDKVNILCLPENTGYDKWNGHRIYGSIGYLINSSYISFLDEDNFVNENHVSNLFKLINKNVDWGYTYRNIVDFDGNFICKDECESLGNIKDDWATKKPFVDINCYLFKIKTLIRVSFFFYRKARPDGLEEVDRIIIKILNKLNLYNECTNSYTVNYMVGNRDDSVQKEFFLEGNKYYQSFTKKVFFSQQGEDLLIYRNFINKARKDGIFLELGACDGLLYSNTMFFEKYLGFRGILIEPVKKFYNKLIKNRSNNICYNYAISSTEDEIEILVNNLNSAVSGIKKHMTKKFINDWHKSSTIEKAKTKTLSEIFKINKINYIDFFSLDVEGGELEVLKTIDWDNITIYLICIELDEHNKEKNEMCRQILLDNGFIFKVKMCINEFWINPNYFRKDLLFDSSIIKKFTGNMNDYGKHIFLESHCKETVEKTIDKFENY